MRVLFWGTPDFATPALRALLGEGFDVVGVETQPDRPVGRSRSTVTPPPVKRVALDEGLPVLQPERPRGEEFLTQLRALNDWLLASGLDIVAMNRIRKRLSRIKGGRLARLLAPRTVLCLAISDVPGDDPRAIGSGPLVADSSLQTAPDITGLPHVVAEALRHSPPAPAADDACFHSVQFEIIARLDDAKRAAAEAARQLGYRVTLHPEFIEGDALLAGTWLAQTLLAAPPGATRVWRWLRRWRCVGASISGFCPPARMARTGRRRMPARSWMAARSRAARPRAERHCRHWPRPMPEHFWR